MLCSSSWTKGLDIFALAKFDEVTDMPWSNKCVTNVCKDDNWIRAVKFWHSLNMFSLKFFFLFHLTQAWYTLNKNPWIFAWNSYFMWWRSNIFAILLQCHSIGLSWVKSDPLNTLSAYSEIHERVVRYCAFWFWKSCRTEWDAYSSSSFWEVLATFLQFWLCLLEALS